MCAATLFVNACLLDLFMCCLYCVDCLVCFVVLGLYCCGGFCLVFVAITWISVLDGWICF